MTPPKSASDLMLEIHRDDLVALNRWIADHCEGHAGRAVTVASAWLGFYLAENVNNGKITEEYARIVMGECLDLARMAFGSCLRQGPMV